MKRNWKSELFWIDSCLMMIISTTQAHTCNVFSSLILKQPSLKISSSCPKQFVLNGRVTYEC
ncbi:hypothetical protein RchiOBHm_Chr3g0450001 [Rosa chinensis]|uniref:Uncharacterized protein n=1 Tax=Rosa chinensis TaxID=74649 RepID=A0A2P6R5N2_ROSCH|nr:hypothetical protein RchiOBHm_Chr3g0450001 [Rosa chinensis]